MEEPKDKAPIDLSAIETIHSLDTARMTLRWALERLRAVEKDKTELSNKLDHESRMRARVEEDYRAQSRSHALRSAEQDQRELYYKKLEELVSLRLAGQLDLSALLKREADAAQLQQLLESRQAHLEKEYLAKRESLELEYQRLSHDLREEALLREKRDQEAIEARRVHMDKENVSKLTALRETEIRLKQAERALAERQANFEQFTMKQRAQLDTDAKMLREDSETQMRLRLDSTRRLLEERHSTVEDAYRQERALLQEQLAEARRSHQEQFPRILELEKKLAVAQEEVRQAESTAERRFLERERTWGGERGALVEAADALSAKLRDAELELRALRSRVHEAEEAAKSSAEALGREKSSSEEAARVWSVERERFLSELERLQAKARQEFQRYLETEQRAETAEEAARQAQNEAARQAARLAEFKAAWEAEQAGLLQELKRSEEFGKERLAAARQLEQALLAAEDARNQAEHNAGRQALRLEEAGKAWETEKAALLEELKSLESQEKGRTTQSAALERELLASQEKCRLAEESILRQEARLAELERAWSAEREALLKELRTLELQDKEHAERGTAFERDLLAAQERHRLAEEAAHRHEGRLDELSRAWESEKAALLSELGRVQSQGAEQSSRISALERELLAAREKSRQAEETGRRDESRLEELTRAWEAEKTALLQELGRLETQGKEQSDRATQLERALFSAEERNRQAGEAAGRQESRLVEQHRAWETEKAGLLAELEQARADAREKLAQLRAAEQALVGVEEKGRLAEHAAKGNEDRLAELTRAWEAERALKDSQLERAGKDGALQANRLLELEARLAASSAAAAQEKRQLLSQLEESRLKIEELSGRAQDLEEDRRAQTLRLEEREQARGREKAGYSDELARAASDLQAEQQRTRTLEEQLQRVLHSLQGAQTEAAGRGEVLREREKAWIKEKDRLIAELEEWRKRPQEDIGRVLELEKRLAASEEAARAARAEAAHKGTALEEREKAFEKERGLLKAELEEWRRWPQEHLARIQELEEALRKAESSGALRLQQEAAARERERAQWQTSLAEKEENARALQSRVNELESRQKAIEEGSQRGQEALAKELSDSRAKAQERLPRILELEKQLAAAREEAQAAKSLAERNAARLEERELALQREKDAWTAELKTWENKTADASARAFEAERNAALAQEAAHKALAALSSNSEDSARLREDMRAKEEKLQAAKRELAQEFQKKRVELEELKLKVQQEIRAAMNRRPQ